MIHPNVTASTVILQPSVVINSKKWLNLLTNIFLKPNTIRLIQRFMLDENRLECHEKNGSKIL